jgi:hypothetical protein
MWCMVASSWWWPFPWKKLLQYGRQCRHPPRPEPKKRKQPTKIFWSVKFLESISTGAPYVRTGQPYIRNLGWGTTAKSSGLTGRRLRPWENPQLSEPSNKHTSNHISWLLSVFDWLNSLIRPDGLLFGVSVSV